MQKLGRTGRYTSRYAPQRWKQAQKLTSPDADDEQLAAKWKALTVARRTKW